MICHYAILTRIKAPLRLTHLQDKALFHSGDPSTTHGPAVSWKPACFLEWGRRMSRWTLGCWFQWWDECKRWICFYCLEARMLWYSWKNKINIEVKVWNWLMAKWLNGSRIHHMSTAISTVGRKYTALLRGFPYNAVRAWLHNRCLLYYHLVK